MSKKFYLLGLFALTGLQGVAQTLPFSMQDLEKELEVEDIHEYVYILKDIDGDSKPELFVKEKQRNYNTHYGLVINEGKPKLVVSRESPNYTEYGYTGDGYFYYSNESGYGNNSDTYWRIRNSKVEFVCSRFVDASTENITTEYSSPNGNADKAIYDANAPKGIHFSFYDLNDWNEFPFDKSSQIAPSGVKADLVPSAWNTTYVEADFNKDGIKDLALLTFPKDKHPIVAIYMGQEGGKYLLFAQNKNLVSVDGGSISVNAKGVITVRVEDGDKANDLSYNLYLFRYQNGDFYRIGMEVNEYDRPSQQSTKASYNYNTKKVLIHQKGKADVWENIDENIRKFTEVYF